MRITTIWQPSFIWADMAIKDSFDLIWWSQCWDHTEVKSVFGTVLSWNVHQFRTCVKIFYLFLETHSSSRWSFKDFDGLKVHISMGKRGLISINNVTGKGSQRWLTWDDEAQAAAIFLLELYKRHTTQLLAWNTHHTHHAFSDRMHIGLKGTEPTLTQTLHL